MMQYTVNYSIRLTDIQHKTIINLRDKYKVNPQHFIRTAIQEKLNRDKAEIINKNKHICCPF